MTDREFDVLWDMVKFIASEYSCKDYVRINFEESYKKEFRDKLTPDSTHR